MGAASDVMLWIFVIICVVLFTGDPDLHDKLVNSFDCAAIYGSK